MAFKRSWVRFPPAPPQRLQGVISKGITPSSFPLPNCANGFCWLPCRSSMRVRRSGPAWAPGKGPLNFFKRPPHPSTFCSCKSFCPQLTSRVYEGKGQGPLGGFSRGGWRLAFLPLLGTCLYPGLSDIPDASSEKIGSRWRPLPRFLVVGTEAWHLDENCRRNWPSETHGVWNLPGPIGFLGLLSLWPPAADPDTPWIRSVGPLPGAFPLAPLGLVPGRPLAQEGAGLEESTILPGVRPSSSSVHTPALGPFPDKWTLRMHRWKKRQQQVTHPWGRASWPVRSSPGTGRGPETGRVSTIPLERIPTPSVFCLS